MPWKTLKCGHRSAWQAGIVRSLPHAAWDTGLVKIEQGREAVPDWAHAAVESDPLFSAYTCQIIYRAGTADSARKVPGLLGRWQCAVASCNRVQRPRGHLASAIDPSLSSRASAVSCVSPSPPPAPLPPSPSHLPSFSPAAPLGRPLCLRAQHSVCPPPQCIVVHPPDPVRQPCLPSCSPFHSPLSL